MTPHTVYGLLMVALGVALTATFIVGALALVPH
jgi:hypothetical protein